MNPFARIERLAQRTPILIMLGLFLLFTLVIFPILTGQIIRLSGGVGLIDGEFSYSPDKVYQMIAAYGEQGRPLVGITTLTADLLYPVIYALFFSLLLIFTFRRFVRAESPFQGLVFLPFVTMLADYLENACLLVMVASFPARLDGVAQFASLFTSLKWGLLLTCLALVALGFLRGGLKALQPK